MMTDNEAFIAGIRAHPTDDLRRLIYADWLEEHEALEKAEYLRIVDVLMRLPEDTAERDSVCNHLLKLSGTLDRDWREAVGRRFDIVLTGAIARYSLGLMQWGRGLIGLNAPHENQLRIQKSKLREDAETFVSNIRARAFELTKGNFHIVPAPLTPSAITAPELE